MIDAQIWMIITIIIISIGLTQLLIHTTIIANSASMVRSQAESIVRSDLIINNHLTGAAIFSKDRMVVIPQRISRERLAKLGFVNSKNCTVCGNGSVTRVVMDEDGNIIYLKV